MYCSVAWDGNDAELSAIAPDGLITSGRSGWYEVNTSGMNGSVIQMVTGTAPSTYPDRPGNEYTCYVTDTGRVYCSVAGYEVDTSSIAPSGQISTSGQWRMIGYFKGTTAGTTITLTGKNLSKVTNVYIDTNNNSTLDEGTDISVSNLKITSDTQLTFTAPSMSAGTYNIIVVNPGNVVPGGTLTYR